MAAESIGRYADISEGIKAFIELRRLFTNEILTLLGSVWMLLIDFHRKEALQRPELKATLRLTAKPVERFYS